jgi:hypothetical protein
MSRRRRIPVAIPVLVFAAAAACVGAGCEDQLFAANEPRSQYDRFDTVRDRHAEQYVEDEFGNRRPNLRGRLLSAE